MERKPYNPLESAELTAEQNTNMIDGMINNLPTQPPEEEKRDKVKEPLCKRRGREREER